MELDIYSVIKKAVVTPKSVEQFNKHGKVTFLINNGVRKPQIKEAVEKIWQVKVDRVWVINRPSKKKSFGRHSFESARWKKAIVSLKEGFKIDLPGEMNSLNTASAALAE